MISAKRAIKIAHKQELKQILNEITTYAYTGRSCLSKKICYKENIEILKKQGFEVIEVDQYGRYLIKWHEKGE